MNRRLAILLAVALAIGALLMVDGGARDAGVSEPVARSRPAAAPASPAAPRVTNPGPAILRLADRDELIGAPDDAFGAGDPAFRVQNWNPPPPAPAPAAAQAQATAPPPPPTAPPLPYVYLGKAQERGVWEVYLSRADQGGQVHIVRGSDLVDGVYRVEAIVPPVLTLTYLPLNQTQTLNIGAPD
jgi:hypothetical protein